MDESFEARPKSNTGPRTEKDHPPVVLQLLPALDSGGVERGTIEIAGAIARAGWISLVASSGGRLERQLARAGGRHFLLPLGAKNPLQIRANIGRLVNLIESEGVDIVHARSRAPAWSGCFAARRTERHFITTFHGTYFGGGAPKRLYNSVMLRGERVIVASRFIRSHVLERYKADASRLRLIPRGVDVERFDPAKVSADRMISLAKQWRLPEGARVVMLPGRFNSWKGQELLVEAVTRLTRNDVCCLLVGDDGQHGNVRSRLDRLIETRGLGGVVRIVGLCQDMAAGYMLADVVVSASTQPEAFGRTIVEAQAMGRPVIATGHGGAQETVLEGETGWLVPPGDPEALARAVERALALDESARAKLAAAATAHIRANFTVEMMCESTLSVYREVLASGSSDGSPAS